MLACLLKGKTDEKTRNLKKRKKKEMESFSFWQFLYDLTVI